MISFAILARHASKVAFRGITAATYESSLAPRAAVRPGVVVFILIAITLALLIVLCTAESGSDFTWIESADAVSLVGVNFSGA